MEDVVEPSCYVPVSIKTKALETIMSEGCRKELRGICSKESDCNILMWRYDEELSETLRSL